MTVKHVHIAIAGVMAELAGGIPKAHRNTTQGYSFRGIDDVLDKMSPALTKHKLLIIPQGEGNAIEDFETKSGGTSFKATVRMRYKFVSLEDGSEEYATVFGEAMDSGDKATNKAHSAAYKLMAIQTFCIPTGDPNADTETQDHDVAARIPKNQNRAPASDKPPCPQCGKTESIINNTYGGGAYACYKARGGCGVKFDG